MRFRTLQEKMMKNSQKTTLRMVQLKMYIEKVRQTLPLYNKHFRETRITDFPFSCSIK